MKTPFYNKRDFHCSFCQALIQPSFQDDYELSDWYHCDTCSVGYMLHCSGGKLELQRFFAKLKDKQYSLDLDFVSKQTEILLIPDKMDDTIVMVLTLPYLIDGVTPDNVQFKIETYLTFS